MISVMRWVSCELLVLFLDRLGAKFFDPWMLLTLPPWGIELHRDFMGVNSVSLSSWLAALTSDFFQFI